MVASTAMLSVWRWVPYDFPRSKDVLTEILIEHRDKLTTNYTDYSDGRAEGSLMRTQGKDPSLGGLPFLAFHP